MDSLFQRLKKVAKKEKMPMDATIIIEDIKELEKSCENLLINIKGLISLIDAKEER